MAERLKAVEHDRGEQGFTIVEVLIALLVLLVGMAGILSLQLTSVQATGFSRHATEASILGEDKMEALRTQSGPALLVTCPVAVPCTDQVDARGVPDPQGLFARSWDVESDLPQRITMTVRVVWLERGAVSETYTITLATVRNL